MVSSRTPGVNVTAANGAAESGATDGAATSRLVASDIGVGEESRTNGIPDGTANVEWNQSGPPSLSMSVDLHNLVASTNHQDSGRYSASPDHAAATTPSTVVKVGCYDEEESYEGFGSVEGDADDGVESPGGSSSAPSPTGTGSRRYEMPDSISRESDKLTGTDGKYSVTKLLDISIAVLARTLFYQRYVSRKYQTA